MTYYLDSEGDPLDLSAAEIGTLTDARMLMNEIARIQPLYELLAKMDAVQQQLDAGKAWETPGGRNFEATRGYLRMMLEAADAGLRQLPAPGSQNDDTRVMVWGTADGAEHEGIINRTEMERWYIATLGGKTIDDMALDEIAAYLVMKGLLAPADETGLTYFEET